MGEVLIWVQGVALLMPALWMTVAVRDNLLHPELNAPYVAQTLDMAEMRRDYPEAYARMAHRRITNPALAAAFFKVAVAWEVLATLALWAAVAAHAATLWGLVPPGVAQAAGLTAAMAFAATWGGFLIVGNHFCYWYARESGQGTHFLMLIWGLATTLILAQG